MNTWNYYVSISAFFSALCLTLGAGCIPDNDTSQEGGVITVSTTTQFVLVESEETANVTISPLLEKELADMEQRIDAMENNITTLESNIIMEWKKAADEMEADIADAREKVRTLRENGDGSSVEVRSDAATAVPALRDAYVRMVKELRATLQNVVVVK